MSPRLRWRLALLIAAGAMAALPARAQSAASSFDQGLKHFQAKEYPEAARSFLRAYRIAPHADALYNAGLAWELAGQPDTAATAYEMALGMNQLDAPAIEDATRRLEKLAPSLGRVEVSSPDGSTLRVAPFVVPGPKAVFYFTPGHHSIHVTYEGGHRRRKGVDATAGRSSVLVIEKVQPKDEGPPAEEPAPKEPPPVHADAGSWRTAGWVSLGAAGVATGAAAVLGIQTIRAHDRYVASGRTDTGAKNQTDTLRTWTNVSWAAAAITAVGGVGILLFAPSDSTTAILEPTGVRLTGRF